MGTAYDWIKTNTYSHKQFDLERLVSKKQSQGLSLSVCIPAREVAGTIGPILEQIEGLKVAGLVDQVVVVDAGSIDGTADVASSLFATVHHENELDPELGPCQGKGDAMWRSLPVLDGDLVVFVDSDTENFSASYITGLIGPLLTSSEVHFVKGAYRRPLTVAGVSYPTGGGRVTEICARPLLSLFFPELGGFLQPLAGEVAASRRLLEEMPFSSGYAVEIAMLIDVYSKYGLGSMAQVDIGSRENRHQSLDMLGPMAFSVLKAVYRRLQREGRMTQVEAANYLSPSLDGSVELSAFDIEVIERPPRKLSKRAA